MSKNFALVPLCVILSFSCTAGSDSKQSSVPAAAGASSSLAAPETYTDALGRRYVQKAIPARIISLSPAVTEILFAIGAGDRVVGVTNYCDYPPEAKTRKSVGGFSGATVSMEQIRALEPDLVILSADMHSRIVSLLDELAIPSFAVEPRDFSQVYDVISLLGEITHHPDGAANVVAEMKKKIAAVEEQLKGKEKERVFWILGTNPLMTAGAGTFVTEALSLGGGMNIFNDAGEQWPQISIEQVLLRKPAWILFGGDMAGAGNADPSDAIFKNPLLASLPAVKQGRIAIVNGDMVYRYGPRLADAVELIAMLLHGSISE